MKKVLQLRGKGKVRKAKAVEVKDLQEYGATEPDSRLALIQELIPIGLMHVGDELIKDVIQLAGDRYKKINGNGVRSCNIIFCLLHISPIPNRKRRLLS